MKKPYITPLAEVITLYSEGSLLLTSNLSNSGGSNTGIKPGGQDPYDGQFHAPNRGWNSDNWTGDNEE